MKRIFRVKYNICEYLEERLLEILFPKNYVCFRIKICQLEMKNSLIGKNYKTVKRLYKAQKFI